MLRHHQHEITRKSGEDEGNLTEAEGRPLKVPDLLVKPREEIYLNCYLPQTTLEYIGFGKSSRWQYSKVLGHRVNKKRGTWTWLSKESLSLMCCKHVRIKTHIRMKTMEKGESRKWEKEWQRKKKEYEGGWRRSLSGR